MSEEKNIPFRYHKNSIAKEDIERAMRYTLSNKAAARYLGVSFPTYRKYASFYKNDMGISLFDLHKNTSGKGISKPNMRKRPPKWVVQDILDGNLEKFSRDKAEVKEFLIREGFLREECYRCQYKLRRQADYKVPLLLNYLDGNKNNFKLDNLEPLCYNCYFLYIGEVFSRMQIKHFENYVVRKTGAEIIDMDLPKHMKEKINSQDIPREIIKDENIEEHKDVLPPPPPPEPKIELPPQIWDEFQDYGEDYGDDLISRL